MFYCTPNMFEDLGLSDLLRVLYITVVYRVDIFSPFFLSILRFSPKNIFATDHYYYEYVLFILSGMKILPNQVLNIIRQLQGHTSHVAVLRDTLVLFLGEECTCCGSLESPSGKCSKNLTGKCLFGSSAYIQGEKWQDKSSGKNGPIPQHNYYSKGIIQINI